MFCRFGLVLESRPVVVATWLKVVWMRALVRVDQPRQRVEVRVLELGQLAPALDLGDDRCSSRIWAITRASVENPVLPRRFLRQTQVLEEDLSELLGEPIVNSWPASSQISACSVSIRSPNPS